MDCHQFLLDIFCLPFLWFRRPQVHINHLPDDILLLIFARLPLTDLLTASLTCHRWHALFPTATHARRDLILKDVSSGCLFSRLRDFYPCSIASAPSAESAILLENILDEAQLEGHLTALLPVHLSPNESVSRTQGSFHFASLAPALPALFPNISRLSIVLAGYTETFHSLLHLLTSWAPNLTTLYLKFCPKEESSAVQSEDTRRLFTQLQTLINSMSNLKHLHFSIFLESTSFSGAPITLNLPIIAQLETFYCCTRNLTSFHDVDLPLTELQHQLEFALAEPNPNISLREVASFNWSTLGRLQLTSPSLAKAFVRLSIDDIIDESNLTTFANLSTQWPHLRSLTIQTSLPLSRFLPLLRPLPRLVHLIVFLHSQADEQPTDDNPDFQLKSIKHLRLYHELTSHQSLRKHVRTLGRHLPSLKVAGLLNQSYQCTDCRYDRNRGHYFNVHLAAGCDAHSVTYLKQVFPRLDIILHPKRFNWREWKRDQAIVLNIRLLDIPFSFIIRLLLRQLCMLMED